MKKALILFGTLLAVLAGVTAKAEVVYPKEPKDFKRVTVMISDETKSSGGTGVILRSSSSSSYVLTNSHICSMMKEGFSVYVYTADGRYSVDHYKRSKIHDLCLIQVGTNLGISTVTETDKKQFGQKVTVSGHPQLLPVTLTEGRLSDNLQISLLFEVEACSDKELKDDPMLCWWFDGMPVIKNFESDVISAVIAPGNSGSAVFNEKGKITGLVFAGHGRGLSHGLIVPVEHINRFIRTESKSLKWVDAMSPKRLSEENAYKKGISDGGIRPLPKDYSSHSKVTFPAAVGKKFDKSSSIIVNCKDDLQVCLRK